MRGPPVKAKSHETLLLLGLCCAVVLPLGILPGQDGGWDLHNYHFYNPYAWLGGRQALDVAPAQLQTWLTPLRDTIPYVLLRSGVPSRLSTALLSIPALLVATKLFPRHTHGWTLLAIVAIGATGAASMPTIGTTMSDWHVTALVVGAVLIVLVAQELVGLAGTLAGIATGLKLTAALFAMGLAALVLVLRRDRRLANLATLAVGRRGLRRRLRLLGVRA